MGIDVLILGGITLLGLAALRTGADSRDGIDAREWEWRRRRSIVLRRRRTG